MPSGRESIDLPTQRDEDVAVDKLLLPFREFMHQEASSGVLLLLAALVALAWANSAWSDVYTKLWSTPVALTVGEHTLVEPLLLWINDGLMAMFFFVVGLEIKREVMVGELSSPREAALPIAAALGGMIVPASIYAVVNFNTTAIRGWGVPMATDIAFALGVLALLGSRVPLALKIFLTALAIADDLGAVLVIAFFYTSKISWLSLASGLGLLVVMLAMNRMGVRSPLAYGVLGIGGVWFAFLLSGIHPTIAGVLTAMTIPARARTNPSRFITRLREAVDEFEEAGDSGESILTNKERQAALLEVRIAYEQCTTPLQRLEKTLHPWISIVILPLFALANAGVKIEGGVASMLSHPVTLGVALGLVMGKQIGITLFAWLAVRFGLAALPHGVTWAHIYGVSWLGGIGFTMSLFIAALAYESPANLAAAKIGVLGASVIAGAVGLALLRSVRGRPAPA